LLATGPSLLAAGLFCSHIGADLLEEILLWLQAGPVCCQKHPVASN
jgi:hypothetical protein